MEKVYNIKLNRFMTDFPDMTRKSLDISFPRNNKYISEIKLTVFYTFKT